MFSQTSALVIYKQEHAIFLLFGLRYKKKMASPTKSPSKKPAVKKAPRLHPSFLDMAVEAITASTDSKGASVPSIRNYITEKYKTVDPTTVKFRLKQALTSALEKNVIVKSKQSDDRPLMSSRYRINKVKQAAEKKKKAKAEEKEGTMEKPVKEKKKKEPAAKKSPAAKKPPAPKAKKPAKEKVKKSPAKKKATLTKKKTPVKVAKPKVRKHVLYALFFRCNILKVVDVLMF